MAFYRRPGRHARAADVREQAALRAALRHCAYFDKAASCCAPRLWHLLHSGGHEQWCNELHNVPVLSRSPSRVTTSRRRSPGLTSRSRCWARPRLSFSAFDPHAPSQYVQQWSTSLQKSLGRQHHAGGRLSRRARFHLQRADLINNAFRTGALQARRPYQDATFVNGTVLPPTSRSQARLFPVSSGTCCRTPARSWYDAGYVNLRRRYANSLSLLVNYTYAKTCLMLPIFGRPVRIRDPQTTTI